MKTPPLFDARRQGNLFLDGECDCSECLMRHMLARSPSEILFRAAAHLLAHPQSVFESADVDARRELELLEHKLEAFA